MLELKSIRSTHGSDLTGSEQSEKKNINTNGSTNSTGDLQQMQEDLIKINQSLDEIKTKLSTLATVNYIIINGVNCNIYFHL